MQTKMDYKWLQRIIIDFWVLKIIDWKSILMDDGS